MNLPRAFTSSYTQRFSAFVSISLMTVSVVLALPTTPVAWIHIPTIQPENQTTLDAEPVSSTSKEALIIITRTYHYHTHSLSYQNFRIDPEDLLAEGASFRLIDGKLPAGLTLDGKTLRGIVEEPGNYQLTWIGTQGHQQFRSRLVIQALPPTLLPSIRGISYEQTDPLIGHSRQPQCCSNPDSSRTPVITARAARGQPTALQLIPDVNPRDCSFELITTDKLTQNPPGDIVLDPDTGILSVTLQTSGVYDFAVTVRDWRGQGSQKIRLVVE